MSEYLFDTHCHLSDEAFYKDLDATIERAKENRVKRVLLACVDNEDFFKLKGISQRYPDLCYPTLGIHPENLGTNIDQQLEACYKILCEHPEIVAIGEIGLDLHWDSSRLEEQIIVLEKQIGWALDRDLPLLFHVRDAMSLFIEVIKKVTAKRKERIRGVMHCYSGNIEDAQEIQNYGDFYFGIGGTLTYKKSLIPDLVKEIGLTRLVLETDAPYLAPVPHRGKRNEPSYVLDTARKLSEILEVSLEEVMQITSQNAENMLRKH